MVDHFIIFNRLCLVHLNMPMGYVWSLLSHIQPRATASPKLLLCFDFWILSTEFIHSPMKTSFLTFIWHLLLWHLVYNQFNLTCILPWYQTETVIQKDSEVVPVLGTKQTPTSEKLTPTWNQKSLNMTLTCPTPPLPSTYHENDVNMPHPTPPINVQWIWRYHAPPHPSHQRTMNMTLTCPTPPYPSTYHEHDVNMPHPTPPINVPWTWR